MHQALNGDPLAARPPFMPLVKNQPKCLSNQHSNRSKRSMAQLRMVNMCRCLVL